MTHLPRLRPACWLTSRVLAWLLAAAMLVSTPGLAPSGSAQGVEETAAAEEVETTPTDVPAEAPVAEPLVDPEPTEEIPVVEPEPPVEAFPPVDEVAPTETLPVVEETLPAEPTVVEETPLAEEPTVEPTASVEETVEPPAAGEGSDPESLESTDGLSGAAPDDAGFGAAAVNLTVTQVLSPTGSPVAGTSVTATASWANAAAGPATGTVRYRVFTGSGCTGALYAEAGTKTISSATAPSGSAPASDAVVMNAAGAHSWQANYSGDASYNPATVCTSQTIVKRTPTIALAVSPSLSTAGTALTGTSNLANLTSTATGNLTYTLYTNSTCSTLNAATGGPSVKSVTGGVAPASDPIVVNFAPTVYWRAVYAGDASNNGITSACVGVTMAKRPTTLGLTLSSESGVAGQPVVAQATINNATTNASGSVGFTAYTNSTCSTAISGTGTSRTVAGGAVPPSAPTTVNLVSTYWRAVYTSDTYNLNSTSPCVLLTLAKATPSGISITALGPTAATMKAAGVARGRSLVAGGTSTAGGTVSYKVFSDSACTSTLVMSGNPKTATVSSRVGASGDIRINTSGTVFWNVTYLGDTNNNGGAVSPCVALSVAKADPVVTMSITPSATPMKTSNTAKARAFITTNTATTTAGGIVTYRVFTDSACTASYVVSGNPHTKTVVNRAPGTGNSIAFPVVGTYYWQAVYGGDAHNNAATGPCSSLAVIASTPTLSLIVYPAATPMRAGGTARARATIGSSNAVAGGSVTYGVYSDSTCATVLSVPGSPSTVTVANKSVPYSAYATFAAIGTVYWQASYTGDANNGAKTSACVALVVGSSTPTLALTTSPAGSVAVDGVVTGAATLTGATSNAGGTATYTVYTDGGCTAQLATTGNPSAVTVANRVVPASGAITFDAVGTFYWRVAYGGDVDNGAAASTCVALTVVKRAPTLGLTVTHPVNPMQAGGEATGYATLAGATTSAAGSVTYTVYSNNACTVAAVPGKTSTEAVAAGGVDASDAYVFDTVGTYYWRAQYGGDAKNQAAVSGCVALDVVDEAAATLELFVVPNRSVAGAMADGVASLSGVTATAGGTVVYTVYDDDGCATPVSPAKSSTEPVVGGNVPASDDFVFGKAGIFYWSAVYSGDPSNDGDTSACVELTVDRTTPTVALTVSPDPVTAGSGAVGSATLSGATTTAGGSATFTVYATNACTTPVSPAKTSTTTVTGAVVPSSAALAVQQAGTVYWRVTYGGDADNQPATSPCVSAVVAKASPTVTLTLAPGSITVWDTATGSASLSGATTAAGGSVVYTVYEDNGCGTPFTPAKTVSKVVSGGTAASAAFAFDMAGVVYWRAVYGGDTNNANAESDCVPLTVNGGPLSASVSSVSLAPVVYRNVEYANAGTMVLTVTDQRGTAEGWSVTLAVSAFNYVGASPSGADIAAGAFSIQTANGPVRVSGQAINGTGGPGIPTGGATGPLDEPIVVLVAADGFGAGVYTQTYSVVLIIPAGSQAGVYTAVVDATTSAAP